MTNVARSTYKIRNWAKYNESLVNRGDITFWFSSEILEQWKHDNAEQGQGRPFVFSDLAIETLLTMRELFRLPYRNTEGFGRWVFQIMQLDLAVPDYTSLCKRAAKLGISILLTNKKGKIDIVVDSTGLKVFGEGEWKVKKHGWAKHRTWRKLHLAIDPETQEIVADDLTDNATDDAAEVPELLEKVPNKVGKFYGDGAYDKWKVYGELSKHKIAPVIPPRRNAKIKQHGNSKLPPLPRDEAIRGIRKYGRSGWKKRIGYHRRSLAETAMFRMKTCFGAHLKNRLFPNQKTESKIRCKILNHFTNLGLPEYF
jgi:Transposase DDE domain.